jgi:hypothetical protein
MPVAETLQAVPQTCKWDPHEVDLALFLPVHKSGNGAGLNGMQQCRGIITSTMEYVVELTVADTVSCVLESCFADDWRMAVLGSQIC